jgi:hypothetical protein
MTDVKKLIIQIRAPRHDFPGQVEEGFYRVDDNSVTLCDKDGKAVGEKRTVPTGGDPKGLACSMLRTRARSRQGSRPGGFNRKLDYGRSGVC